MSKHQIDIFTRPSHIPAEDSACEGCGGCDLAGARQDPGRLEQLLKGLSEGLGAAARVVVHRFDSQEQVQAALPVLNRVLTASGEDLRANEDNLTGVLAGIMPLVAIDGVMACFRRLPSLEALLNAIEHGTPIEGGPVCGTA